MTHYRRELWEQWDRQVQLWRENTAYIKLNNLYISIETGKTPLTITTSNTLRTLATQAYAQGDTMVEWWLQEFMKLPGWFDV